MLCGGKPGSFFLLPPIVAVESKVRWGCTESKIRSGNQLAYGLYGISGVTSWKLKTSKRPGCAPLEQALVPRECQIYLLESF